MKQILLRMPDQMCQKLDSFVDGIQFRDRTHLINLILTGWLEKIEITIRKDEIERKAIMNMAKKLKIEFEEVKSQLSEIRTSEAYLKNIEPCVIETHFKEGE